MNHSNDEDPTIIYSDLCQNIDRDGIKIEVCIIRLEHETDWTLEVVNENGTSIVWDDVFLSDKDAFAELQRTIEKEGMKTFLDDGNVVTFPKA